MVYGFDYAMQPFLPVSELLAGPALALVCEMACSQHSLSAKSR